MENESSMNRVELKGSDSTSIQVTLFPDQASITVPFWHDPVRAAEVFEEVARYATVLVERGGYRIFDPQLGAIREFGARASRSILSAQYEPAVSAVVACSTETLVNSRQV